MLSKKFWRAKNHVLNLKSLRALSDRRGLRIVALLERGRTVRERTSGNYAPRPVAHLHAPRPARGTARSCNRGAKASDIYKLNPQATGDTGEFIQLAIRGAKELAEHGGDQNQSQARPRPPPRTGAGFLQSSAGRFDRVYGPGRSWQAFGHLLLRILRRGSVAIWAQAKFAE